MTTIEAIQDIMRDLFDEEDLVISPETTAEDVEEWDSMNHVRLIIAIENKFSIQLTIEDVNKLKNVGQLVALVDGTRQGTKTP